MEKVMELHPVLKELDFSPEPMYFQRPDKKWVSFCDCHQWAYCTSIESVAAGMLNEHVQLQHPELAIE